MTKKGGVNLKRAGAGGGTHYGLLEDFGMYWAICRLTLGDLGGGNPPLLGFSCDEFILKGRQGPVSY